MQRFHGFDLLRGIIMLLDIALHGALNYTAAPLGERFPMKDPSVSLVFDGLALFIYTFRVPVFLLLSGFFAAMLVEKKGRP